MMSTHSAALRWQVDPDPDGLAAALTEHVCSLVTELLKTQDTVVFAVSGGSTPLRFFRALSQRVLPWSRVVFTLVDDRAVPWDHPRSNTILVRENLLQNHASTAQFVPLTHPDGRPVSALIWPGRVDIAHFGMGSDGHTASWFPGGDRLTEALADDGPERVSMGAAGAPEPRTTFTWSALRQARHAILHYEGAAKAVTMQAALGDGPIANLPVRRLLRQSELPLTIFTDRAVEESP